MKFIPRAILNFKFIFFNNYFQLFNNFNYKILLRPTLRHQIHLRTIFNQQDHFEMPGSSWRSFSPTVVARYGR